MAQRVHDGMTVAVGGTLFTRMPVRLLTAVCETGLRNLHYASWGGGLPLEMLLEADAVTTATICFSSLDVFGQARRFQAAVTDGSLELREWTALAFHQALWAGKRRLPSEPFVWPLGSDLVDLPGYPRAVSDPVSGDRVGAAPALRPDALLLHAPAADKDGNIVLVGARATDPLLVSASHQVLVTVDALVERDDLRRFQGGIVIPRHFVTAVSVVPGGAAPTSSLPYYIADFAGLMELAASAEPFRFARGMVTAEERPLRRLPEVDAATVAASLEEPVASGGPATTDEWITCWLARQYDDDAICSVGAVSPLATASYLLAKAARPGLTLITNGGGHVDVAQRPLLLGLGEWLDCCSAVTLMGGDESYEWYYLPGRVTHEVVSVAQIDAAGRTNNREVFTPSGKRLRLPGQGGMADVADMHKNFVVYLPRQSKLNTPERVDFSTASRALLVDDERRRAGYQPGSVLLVTNLAVFRLDKEDRRFRLQEVFPWTTSDELADATGFELGVQSLDGIPVVEAPTDAELDTLRRVCDPLGIRRLEFVPSRDRGPLLASIIAAEARLAKRVLDVPFHR